MDEKLYTRFLNFLEKNYTLEKHLCMVLCKRDKIILTVLEGYPEELNSLTSFEELSIELKSQKPLYIEKVETV